MSHFGAGLSGKKSHEEYMNQPLFSEIGNEPKYAESNEEVAVYEMKQRTRMLAQSGLNQSPD